MAAPTAVRGSALSRHPPATLLLCFVEMLERFSFYAMSGLLALFLAGTPAQGGFGWSKLLAIQTYGIYVGLLWLAPLIGGWIGDHRLGARRAVIVGGFMIAAGQALMTSPALVPGLIESLTGVPVGRALAHAGVALGHPIPGGETLEALTRSLGQVLGSTPTEAQARAVTLAYLLPANAFFIGLALLAIGNGLLKPNITVMLGDLYAPDDPDRDEAFTLFYIGINVGAVLSALLAGTVAERFGWTFGFGISSMVVLAGIGVMLQLLRLFPPGVGDRPVATATTTRRKPLPRAPLLQVVILMVFAAVFWGAFMQTFGLLSLFAFNDVDREIGSFTVPAAWFSSLTPFFLTFIGPVFQAGLNALRRRGAVPSTMTRFVAGLLIAAAAFAILAGAIALQPTAAKSSMLWLVLFYLILSVAELSLSPAGNAMATRGVGPDVAGRLMAIWFLCYGVGSFLSSVFGGLSAWFSVATVLGILSAVLLATGALLWLIRGVIERLVAPESSRAADR